MKTSHDHTPVFYVIKLVDNAGQGNCGKLICVCAGAKSLGVNA